MASSRATKPARGTTNIVFAVAIVFGAMPGAMILPARLAFAQKWQDEGFTFRRVVQVQPSGSQLPEIVVCQFFSHHAIDPSSPAVTVFGRRDLLASQLLQIGPGDLCRVAFQTRPEETRYTIYYGGKPKEQQQAPEWAGKVGLLLETRHWKSCDLGRLDSVRSAFEESTRIGADFVPQVYHRFNPMNAEATPFLSRYVGQLQVPLTGPCAFFTSSQDCSFLLIDGNAVVASPGRHPPVHDARIHGEVTLKEGPHRFEYYHAAAGAEACMVAAWQLPGFASPSLISAAAFGGDRVAHVLAGELEHREQGYLPDFRLAVVGDIATPAGDSALVRVQFANSSPKQIAGNAKYAWQFGDGQTSEQENPTHVYLHPGSYEVTLRLSRGLRTLQLASAVQVPRQFVVDPKDLQQEQKLSEYLAVLDQYDAASLDPLGLELLVRTYVEADQKAKAATVAKVAFAAEAKQTDESRWAIVSQIGPILRFELADARGAGEMWYAASRLINRAGWRVACAVESADILVNDLLSATKAKSVLDAAKDQLGEAAPVARSRYFRVLADCLARQGDADNARAAYRQAEVLRELPYRVAERDAWRGAHSRSAEAYLQSQEFDRARGELEQWLTDFPQDKCEGYLSSLLVRYWKAVLQHEQALAVAADLLTVNPASPYADRLVVLTAECEEQLGRLDRAAAAFQSLVTDYPGSPLVEKAKAEIQRLKSPTVAPESAVKARRKSQSTPPANPPGKGRS